jgi:DNA-binding NtrC family response regulator
MMKKDVFQILIVDDNKSILNSLEFLLQFKYSKIICINNPNQINEKLRCNQIDLVLLDMNFKPGSNTGNEGLFWLNEIRKYDETISVILITAYGDINLAVKGVKQGANDFIVKPWENEKLLSTVNAALKLRESNIKIRLLSERQEILKSDAQKDFKNIIGESEEIKKVFKIIDKVAVTDANILISGENGTGKELVAYEIYRKSNRSNEPLIKIDIGAIPETLFESELFGHVKGAFTDAKEDRAGRFEIASGGTLFIDEIGNLPLSLQSKLLSVIQNREIFRLGSSKPVPIDIRLICATNSNLKKLVEDFRFREDLLFRINTIQIVVPPLRVRENDIILLAKYFLEKYSKRYKKAIIKIDQKAIDKLKKYRWPGNVRELEHTVEKAVILSESSVLSSSDFIVDIEKEYHISRHKISLEETERIRIIEAMENNQGNLNKTADELKIARQTLYRKIKKYKL